MRKLLIVSILFLVTSCSSETPNGILKQKKMQDVIYDLLRADEFVINYKLKDTTLNRKKESIKMYEQVFRIHNTTKTEFYKSYKYYQEHPDKNKVIFDSLYESATRKKTLASPIKLPTDTSVKKK